MISPFPTIKVSSLNFDVFLQNSTKKNMTRGLKGACGTLKSKFFHPATKATFPQSFLKGPNQLPPFSMPSKLLIVHSEVKSECFTIGCVPESLFKYL